MPVNLENLLRQAATCIDPKKDKGAYAYMIGDEVADHIAQVRSGEIPLDVFAEHYGLHVTSKKTKAGLKGTQAGCKRRD